MFSNTAFVVLLLICVVYKASCNPEAPFRHQRFRQPQFFARQQAPPYAPAGTQPNVPFNLPEASNTPSTKYGPPPPPEVEPLPSTSYGVPVAPSNQYGAPIQQFGTRDTELGSDEAIENPDAEILPGSAPARLRSQKLRNQPGIQRSQFERLRLQTQQQHQQLQQLQDSQRIQQLQQQQHQLQELQRFQQLQQQPQGSYFIQLPNGSIQRVAYSTLPNIQDNTVSAQLKFRPVALAATESQILEPQPLFVNTFVTSYNVE